MCNYQLLASDNLGYIKRCDSCKKVKIVFGTLAATMYVNDLNQIKASLLTQLKDKRFQPSIPNVFYELPLNENISINMNRAEMQKLFDMVSTASNMVEVYSLIDVEAEG